MLTNPSMPYDPRPVSRGISRTDVKSARLDLGEFLRVGLGADREPVVEVVGHVVAAEGQHGHRVEAQLANRADCCSGDH